MADKSVTRLWWLFYIKGEGCDTTTFIELLISLSHLLLAINSACNFVIYMWRGDKFRRVFRKTVRRWLCLPAEDPTLNNRQVGRKMTDLLGLVIIIWLLSRTGTRYRYFSKSFTRPESIPLTRRPTSKNESKPLVRAVSTYTPSVLNGQSNQTSNGNITGVAKPKVTRC